jgi:acetoin utilization protein AcuB
MTFTGFEKQDAKRVMTRSVKVVHLDAPIGAAFEAMEEHRIRHLPVIDDSGRMIGIISDRDVAKARHPVAQPHGNLDETPVTFESGHRVRDYMSWPVLSVCESEDLAVVANRMIQEKISALMVTDANDHPRGIVTTEDLLRQLVLLLGASVTPRKIALSSLSYDRVDCV